MPWAAKLSGGLSVKNIAWPCKELSVSSRRSILFFVLVAACAPLFSIEINFTEQGSMGRYCALVPWKYAEGDDMDYADVDFQDSSWKIVSVPFTVPLKDGFCWLRTEIQGSPELLAEALYLSVDRLDSAAEIYLNGSLIARRGVLGPTYSTPVNKPGVFFLPPGLLKSDARNVLALRLKSPASEVDIPAIKILDRTGELYEDTFVSFFNFELYSILGILCASIGLYFLSLWLTRRQDTPNLWYAISSFAIGYYFIEMGSTVPLLPYSINRAVAKACLTISMASLVAFFIDYFQFKRRRLVVGFLVAIPLVSLIAYVLVRKDNVALNSVFNLNLIFVQISILFIIVASVRGVIRRAPGAIPILIGVVIGVALGTHDVIYAMRNLKPFAWLQGLGFFSMNISLFITLTQRSSRLYKELENYSKDVEDKTRQLSTYISRIEQTAASVSAITAEIDADAGAAAASADKLAAEAEHIGMNADKQAQAARDSEEAVARLGQSLGLVRSGVDSQAAGIAESAQSVAIVADSAASVSESVESTAAFARGLDGTAEQGRHASRNLDEAIARIKEAAGEVSSTVGAVEDFAERTNLLSMNAAIEAAHAGAAGRGFAVIAGEIKGLASASAERTVRIRESISDIVKRIENGVGANAEVAQALDSVADGAKVALTSILSVSTSLTAQSQATDKLRTALESLSASASSIRAEAERQDEDGRRIGARMAELVSLSNELRESIAGIAKENAAIAETTKHLASVSRDGKEAVSGLRLILESRQKA
jgi:methyl-accepting chemotaxis protein